MCVVPAFFGPVLLLLHTLLLKASAGRRQSLLDGKLTNPGVRVLGGESL